MKVQLKKTVKNVMLPIMVCVALGSSPLYAQGIPVIDASAIAKHIEQIVQMKKQIENQVSQIVELKNQVQALTSVDALKDAAKSMALDNIPTEWKDIYKDIGGLTQVDVDKLLSGNNYNPNGAQLNLVNYANSLEKAFKETTDRFSRLDVLQAKLQKATNIKEAADIQNQIATENAAIAVSQTQLDNLARVYEIQKEINEEQKWLHDFCKNWGDLEAAKEKCL